MSAYRTDEKIVRAFDGDPATGVVGGLTLQIGIVGLVPAHDFIGQVVENEIAAIGANGEDRVPFTVRLANDGDQKIGDRDTGPLQFTLL